MQSGKTFPRDTSCQPPIAAKRGGTGEDLTALMVFFMTAFGVLLLNVLMAKCDQINAPREGVAPEELLWEAEAQVLWCSSSLRQLATDS